MKLYRIIQTTCLLSVIISMTVNAQVTIGETEAPVNGALLQLKNMANINGAEINADKGLALPRVNLISKTALYPMFTTTTDTLNTIYKKKHVGLTIYNTNRCLTKNEGKDGRGIWIWDGTMWNNASVLDEVSSLFVSTDLLDLPSGSDARGAVVPVDLGLIWSPVEKQVSYSTPIASPPLSNFDFTSITPASPISSSSGKASVSFLPVAMVIPTNPWQSRQVEMIFTLVDTECGNINKKVILNQTNYVLRSYNNGYNYTGVTKNFLNIASDFIKLTDTNPFYLRIRGNADWKVTVKDNTNVITHNISATGNAELNNFTNTPWPGDFVVTGVKYPGGKYTKASILIEDQYTPHRAKPVTVTCYSCIGTPDLSSVTITANNMQTELGDPGWGTNVVCHLAKHGIYEEFYSADFGDAGRWMTTNLAATAYDDNTHSQGKTLNGPYIMGYYDEPHWCYPKAHGSIITIGESPSQEYIDNPVVGFLYNWDAATAGKGGSTGKYPLVNEKGFTEGGGTGQQERIQGVCPKGWHLPSDYEWTELENEIITRTTKYSETNENIGPPLLSFTRPQGSQGSHGAAMKDSCEPIYRADREQGYSKGYFQGGFNVAFAGWAVNNQTANFNSAVFFWTSSATGAWGNAWMRQFLSSSNGVDANRGGRHTGAPVRCKKDE